MGRLLRGRRDLLLLLAILATAAGLRLWRIGSASPPGLNQDEAVTIWNAQCLLRTGHDHTGAAWPIFYMRCFGDNPTTLFTYFLIPFEAIGGMNVLTARLAVALTGIATILLVAFIGTRMFGRATGFAAAALLAVNPWHVQQSRWAADPALTPFLVSLCWAALLWARFPIARDAGDPPRPVRAALAGVLFGVSSYGYPSMRIFLPLFLAAVVVSAGRRLAIAVRSRRAAAAIFAFGGAWLAVFGPLVWRHATDPEINKRALTNWVWAATDSAGEKILAVLGRYLAHFDVSWLFVHSRMLDFVTPPAGGYLDWYVLPLLVAGLIAASLKAVTSAAYRVALAAFVLYPVGDCLNSAESLHPLRSLAGVCGIVMIAAVGAIEGWRWLRARSPRVATLATAILVAVALASCVRGYRAFFGEFNERPWTRAAFHVDLVEACEWLRPRFDRTDAVFCTTTGMNMPYVVAMVALDYDARRWFRDERRTFTIDPWEYHSQVGKIYFMYVGHDRTHDVAWDSLAANATPDRVVVIARPGEVALENPAHVVRDDDGTERLLIYETTL